MPGSLSLACLRSLGLEEGRLGIPPLATPATDPETSPGPSPPLLVLLLPDTGKGKVEAGLLAELCLLS